MTIRGNAVREPFPYSLPPLLPGKRQPASRNPVAKLFRAGDEGTELRRKILEEGVIEVLELLPAIAECAASEQADPLFDNGEINFRMELKSVGRAADLEALIHASFAPGAGRMGGNSASSGRPTQLCGRG